MCLEGAHLSQGISIDIAFCKTKKNCIANYYQLHLWFKIKLAHTESQIVEFWKTVYSESIRIIQNFATVQK